MTRERYEQAPILPINRNSPAISLSVTTTTSTNGTTATNSTTAITTNFTTSTL